MSIKNDDELASKIKNIMYIAIKKSQSDVYNIIESFMRTYYHEYDPLVYGRTYAFFNSLVKSEIVSVDGGFRCQVEIDTDLMDKYKHHSGEAVMDMINRGFHADTKMNNSGYHTPHDIAGTRVWDESIAEIEKTNLILNTFQDYFNKYAK